MTLTRLLPLVGDELLLTVPQTEQVLARVDADGPGWFELTLLEAPLTHRTRLERSALMLEYAGDDGVARLHGRLDVPVHRRGVAGGYAPAERVRFAHRGSPQRLTRREYVRAAVQLPLWLRPAGADDEAVTAHAQALDLSGGGLLVVGLPALEVGAELDFGLELPEGPTVGGRCAVVRVGDGDRTGVRFVDVADDDRVRLAHTAFGLSRAQRRRIA